MLAGWPDDEGRPTLAAYPAQCNATGARLGLELGRRIKRRAPNTAVLLDAAAYLSTSVLDLGAVPIDEAPDFVVCSFYKILVRLLLSRFWLLLTLCSRRAGPPVSARSLSSAPRRTCSQATPTLAVVPSKVYQPPHPSGYPAVARRISTSVSRSVLPTFSASSPSATPSTRTLAFSPLTQPCPVMHPPYLCSPRTSFLSSVTPTAVPSSSSIAPAPSNRQGQPSASPFSTRKGPTLATYTSID